MMRSFRFTLAAATFVLALAATSAAIAAPAPWEQIEVTLHPEDSRGVLMVTGQLPQSASLPAEAELSVPSGAKILWIGELLGGAPSQDPTLKYSKSSVGNADVYRFTLSQARTAQIELEAAAAQSLGDSTYGSALKWVSNQDVPKVVMSVRVPQGTQIVEPSPGAALEPGQSGVDVYTKTVENVKAGNELDLNFTYTAPAGSPSAAQSPAPTTPGGSSSSPVALILVTGAFLLLAAVAFTAIRRKLNEKSAPDSAVPDAVAAGGPARTPDAGSQPSTLAVDAVATMDAGEIDASEEQGLRRSGMTKKRWVATVFVGVLVVVVVAVAQATTKPKLTGGVITKTFSQGEPCTTSDVALALPNDADPTETAETLFEALGSVKGLNSATYNQATSQVQIGFCDSKTTEEAVRAALAPTGLLAQE